MSKNIFYDVFRFALVGISLLILLALAPGTVLNVQAQDEPEMPSNDTRILPATVKSRQTMVERYFALAPVPSYAPSYYDTSVYMLGDVAVGIVLPESAGGTENWTTIEKNAVVNEIQTGLNWWKTTGGTLADLTFNYDLQLGVPTTYEPISRPSSDDALWINQVMSNLGYTTGDYWDKVYAYNNAIRKQYQTDWAFTIFVVDSSADIDGMFTDGYFAYAYMGGPFLVMTYDNDGWGIDDMDKITAHETGHIFMAGDQYGSCSTIRRYGYLGIANGNCNGNPSIMKDNSWAIDTFAKGQIGWKDTDSDNIPDILDTTPVVTAALYSPNPTVNKLLSYNGSVKNPAYSHAVCGTGDWCYSKDVTIQSIANVNFQVDSETWNAAIAQDGVFDSDVEDFSFTTKSLSPGIHSIKLTSKNASGNTSAIWNDSVVVNTPAPALGPGKYDDNDPGWTYTGDWGNWTGSGPYNNTFHYSSTVNSYATFTFEGTLFKLIYAERSSRGEMDIFVDDNFVTTINAYNPVATWQKTWTIPSALSAGIHTVKVVHKSGTYIDIDAIEIDPSPWLGTGKYDDTHSGFTYTGDWATWTGSGPYNNTFHYSSTVNSSAIFTFQGTMFKLIYAERSSRGEMDIFVDDNFVTTINAYNPVATWQKTWNPPSALSTGPHTVKVVHKSGTYIDIDGIEVINLEFVPPSTIDNLAATTGLANGEVQLSWTAPGDDGTIGTASSYLVRYADTEIQTEADWNSAIPVTSGVPNPKAYGSPESMIVGGLLPGHTYFFAVRAEDDSLNLGDLSNSPSAMATIFPPPPGTGKYDDTNSGWTYTGGWATWTGVGPYNNTFYYSNTVDSYATFTFQGNMFNLVYSERSTRGEMDIYIDNSFVATVNAYNPVATWQKTWTLPSVLSTGIHTVKVVHKSGAYIDIDAIEIIEPPPIAQNDPFAFPTTISNMPYTDTVDVAQATTSVEDPQVPVCNSDEGKKSVWYTYTPPSSGLLHVDTFGSNYDTLIAIWKGNGLSFVACNDDATVSSFQSELNGVLLTGGARYYIEVIERTQAPQPSPAAAPNPNVLKLNADFTPVTLVGTGKYDDTHPGWNYTGNWAAWTGSGPYNNTFHYSSTVNSTATFFYEGAIFSLSYSERSTRGEMDVYVDNIYVATINAYNPVATWQKAWYPPSAIQEGSHSVKVVHKSGAYIDIDAIEIFLPDSLPPSGISDLSAVTGSANGQVQLSWTAPGDDGTIGTASSYLVRYADTEIQTEADWNSAIPVTSGVPNPKAYDSPESMIVGGLLPSDTYFFAIRARDEGLNLGPLSNSPSAMAHLTTPVPGDGKYDDTHSGWTYTGNWATWTGVGPYNNTFYYSSTVDSYATFTFEGNMFNLIYSERSTRGEMDIYIDNNFVATVNAYNPIATWQKTWSPSTPLSAGIHTVKVVHKSGTYIDIDAIEIQGTPGTGKYDDTHSSWKYIGNWATWTGVGPYNNTFYYSSTVDSYATFTFEGTKFNLIYSERNTRGEMDIFVDNNFITTVNAYNNNPVWQKSWSLPSALSTGTHTVKVVHKSGTYIDIDAIEILP